ncbi:MAG: cupin-like domain-containing protein [Proteobacteria bacterium]|nr:cupin-like domain-containing protein [Pseudomonadota bacterium]
MLVERIPYRCKKELRNLIQRKHPFILTGAIDHWPAVSKWNLDYLCQHAGHKTVACELGPLFECTRVTDDGDIIAIKRARVPLSKIIRVIKNHTHQDIYASEWNIFEDCPDLLNDIDLTTPDLYNPVLAAKPKCYVGPANAFTPIHYDHAPNFTAQIFGRKQWTFYPPSQLKYLHLYPRFSQMGHFSRAHCLADLADYSKFPDLRRVTPQTVVINQGEVLYIPIRWAHHVTSLEPTISLHFFWKTWAMYLKQLAYQPAAHIIGGLAASDAKLNIRKLFTCRHK